MDTSLAQTRCSWSIDPSCVGWFFESVVGRILNSSYLLKGFEFYSSGCTSYPSCLQLVTMDAFSASYPW
jgi:hypothetical protein